MHILIDHQMLKAYMPSLRHSLFLLLKQPFSSSKSKVPHSLTVFYDASCSVCDWEISHYKELQAKHPNLERIEFQDISKCAAAATAAAAQLRPTSHPFCSDNHALLAQRNISQEQALEYFHGIAAIMFLRIFI